MSMDEQISTAVTVQAPTSTAEEDPYLAANRGYFDKEAHKYGNHPVAIKLASEVGKIVTSKFPFDEDKTVLLDFACGTGAMPRILHPDNVTLKYRPSSVLMIFRMT
jgi:hypothetical protein